MKFDDVLARLERVTRTGQSFKACCPAHDDQTPSLSIRLSNGRMLLKCHGGPKCSTEDVARSIGLTMADLFDEDASSYERARVRFPASSGSGPGGTRGTGKSKDWGKLVATYEYRDANGVPLHFVERRELHRADGTYSKDFPQGRLVNGRKVYGLGGVKTVLYRLPDLLAAPLDQAVYIAEGEKDVLALVDRGLVATCNTGGALKFRADHAEPLRGRPVVIVMDKDDAGRDHARLVAALLDRVAASVRVVQAKSGKDAHDHFAAGHSVEDFEEIDMSELNDKAENLDGKAAASGQEQSGKDSGKDEKESPVAVLEKILERLSAECWRDEDRRPLITLTLDGKLRHAEIGSPACDDLLCRVFYLERRKALGEQVLAAASRQLRVKALYEGEQRVRARRISATEHEVYLALLDDEQRAIRVTATGWAVVGENECPGRFVREPGAQALPVPVPGGDLQDLLGQVVNVEREHLPLVAAFLVGVFLPEGTMPVLAVSGQQGAGKTFGSRTLRGIVDPQVGGLQRLPRDPGALMAVVNAADVLAFDNVSKISEDLSDCLCSITSGIALDARKLYTNKELERVRARLPLILNGIGDIVSKPDLMDRSLFVTFRTLPEAERKGERELLQQLEALRPRLLGAVLDRVSRALRELGASKNPGVRLSDFGRWALAACADDDERGRLERAFKDNRERLQVATIDNDEFAQALIAWVEELGEVTMTASQILKALNANREQNGRRVEGWPARPEAVGKALSRLAPTLSGVGIEVKQLPRSGRSRPWHLKRGPEPSQPSQPSTTGPVEPVGPDSKHDGTCDSLDEQGHDASTSETLFEPEGDSNDGCDSSDLVLEEILI